MLITFNFSVIILLGTMSIDIYVTAVITFLFCAFELLYNALCNYVSIF